MATARGTGREADPFVARAPRRSPRVRAAVGGVLLLTLLGLATAVVGAVVTPGGTTTTVPGNGGGDGGGEARVEAGVDGGGDGGGYGGASGDSSTSEDAALSDTDDSAENRPSAVIVHVLGAVRTPGIVELRPGDRVVDAIAATGGTTDDADLAGVNLARILADGEQLRVPRVGEAVVPLAPDPAAGGGGVAAGSGGAAGAAGTVNINTADAAALETLPGVGPVLASSIISWRDENGAFRAVDELLAVSGIGEKTLDGFREQVSL